MQWVVKLIVLIFLSLSLHSSDLKKNTDEEKVLKEAGYIIDKYPKIRFNWEEGKKYCENIHGRLPTILEFKDIYIKVGKKSKYFGGEWFWAKDETDWRHHNGAYRFNFYDGRDDVNVKDAIYYIRCINKK